MMGKLFGTPEKKKKVTMEQVSESLERRITELTTTVDRLRKEVEKYEDQLGVYKTRGIEPPKALKQRMMNTLTQQHRYEIRLSQLMNQKHSLEYTSFTVESMKDSLDHIKVLKAEKERVEAYLKQADLCTVEALQDDLNDLLLETNDIQQVLGNCEPIDSVDEDEMLQLNLASIGSDTTALRQQDEQQYSKSSELNDLRLHQPLSTESIRDNIGPLYLRPAATSSIPSDVAPATAPSNDSKTTESHVHKAKIS